MTEPVELGPCDIITDVIRISFPSLAEPKAFKDSNDEPKYQAALLFPPDTDFGPYKACMIAAMTEEWGAPIRLKAGKNPIKSCEEKEELEGYDEGWHFMNVSSMYQPQVIGPNKREILDVEDTVKAGYWCRFHLKVYAWNNEKGGKGVSFGLEAVQFVKKGDRIDGRKSAQEVFGDIVVEGDDDLFESAEDGDAAIDDLFSC